MLNFNNWFLVQALYSEGFSCFINVFCIAFYFYINIQRQISTHRRISMIDKMILRYTDKK